MDNITTIFIEAKSRMYVAYLIKLQALFKLFRNNCNAFLVKLPRIYTSGPVETVEKEAMVLISQRWISALQKEEPYLVNTASLWPLS